MCLVLVGWRAHPEYRLIVAANRDEFYTRATETLRWWPEAPDLLAGRDLGAGGEIPGTWLGVAPAGRRFATVTNVRRPGENRTDVRSRGALLMDYLRGEADPEKTVRAVAAEPDDYNGYNLVVSDLETLWWHSNRSGSAPQELAPGFHGISNDAVVGSAEPDSRDIRTGTERPAWPKVREGVRALRSVVESTPGDIEGYLRVLADRTRALDTELPDTGLSRRMERTASARFIAHTLHGTRCSTVLLVREDGGFEMVERSFGRFGRERDTRSYSGRIGLDPN
ncbi:NRDE family protein [Nocardia otitidiscaviarum]|uniref:NRDE family protein n=1 Tax=Nocardia otitidiscaviarum TaxID=1823 RepID=UPI0018963017|nr:NRDE family protein [Nocardia otitidiscaviarum]MBF6183205.1 NRDE family protein [Nocardia otitidiscaviarum]